MSKASRALKRQERREQAKADRKAYLDTGRRLYIHSIEKANGAYERFLLSENESRDAADGKLAEIIVPVTGTYWVKRLKDMLAERKDNNKLYPEFEALDVYEELGISISTVLVHRLVDYRLDDFAMDTLRKFCAGTGITEVMSIEKPIVGRAV